MKYLDMKPLEKLLSIMKKLRSPEGGCPWDQQQNFASIAPYTVEEAYEVADAIQRGAMDDLKSELGDLLFQVVFHAQMAGELGLFQFKDVVECINEKLVRRHPHVFGDAKMRSAAQQTEAWEVHKANERQRADDKAGALGGVAVTLPAMVRSIKLQKRAARVGFDWTETQPIFVKIQEEIEEIRAELTDTPDQQRIEDEVGDLLFAVTNLARHLRCDPERALAGTNARFTRRFQHMEDHFATFEKPLAECTLDELETAWQRAKSAEKINESLCYPVI